tara:strand:- start:135 stop:743 length:609 start_codon:yes stop_codon:yes gene_type:complete
LENNETDITLAKEQILLTCCASGDRASYAKLYTSYLSIVLDYVYLFTGSRELSEEIVQDLFVKIWEKRAVLQDVQHFKPYLFRTVKNMVMDYYRHKQVEDRFRQDNGARSEESEEQSDFDLIYNQYYELAEQAINLLPEKRREIFKLRTQQDLSLDEIADQLQISKSVVKKQYYAATFFIKEYLRKHGEIMTNVVIFMYLLF